MPRSKAEQHVGVLKSYLPEVFENYPGDLLDDWVVIPDEGLDKVDLLTDLLQQPEGRVWQTDSVAPPWIFPEGTGAFPGCPLNYRGQGGMVPPPPDALAFYLPYHYYPDLWGIYLIVEGVADLAKWLHDRSAGSLSLPDCTKASKLFLYGHEHYHHIVECFATRLEVTHRRPLYKIGFDAFYKEFKNDDLRSEEALANGYGGCRLLDAVLHKWKSASAVISRLLEGFGAYFNESQGGYRGGLRYIQPGALGEGEQRFAEGNHQVCFPPQNTKPLPQDIWDVFPHAFHGFGQINSRINYVIPKGSPLLDRLPADLRRFRYRDVSAALRALGASFERMGKGSHEIWRSSQGGKITVPNHPRDMKVGTLRSIMRQAGFYGSIHEFLGLA